MGDSVDATVPFALMVGRATLTVQRAKDAGWTLNGKLCKRGQFSVQRDPVSMSVVFGKTMLMFM